MPDTFDPAAHEARLLEASRAQEAAAKAMFRNFQSPLPTPPSFQSRRPRSQREFYSTHNVLCNLTPFSVFFVRPRPYLLRLLVYSAPGLEGRTADYLKDRGAHARVLGRGVVAVDQPDELARIGRALLGHVNAGGYSLRRSRSRSQEERNNARSVLVGARLVNALDDYALSHKGIGRTATEEQRSEQVRAANVVLGLRWQPPLPDGAEVMDPEEAARLRLELLEGEGGAR